MGGIGEHAPQDNPRHHRAHLNEGVHDASRRVPNERQQQKARGRNGKRHRVDTGEVGQLAHDERRHEQTGDGRRTRPERCLLERAQGYVLQAGNLQHEAAHEAEDRRAKDRMPQIAEERPRHSGIERPPAVLLAPQDKGALRSEGRCEEERRGQGKHDRAGKQRGDKVEHEARTVAQRHVQIHLTQIERGGEPRPEERHEHIAASQQSPGHSQPHRDLGSLYGIGEARDHGEHEHTAQQKRNGGDEKCPFERPRSGQAPLRSEAPDHANAQSADPDARRHGAGRENDVAVMTDCQRDGRERGGMKGHETEYEVEGIAAEKDGASALQTAQYVSYVIHKSLPTPV